MLRGIMPALLPGLPALLAGALVATQALAAEAVAEVTLATTVDKVETTLDTGGRVKRQLVPAESVVPGEELRYTIRFTNESDTLVDAGRIVITNPVPDGTRYLAGSAAGESSVVEFSLDGETFDTQEPAAESASPAPETQNPGAQSAERTADSAGVHSIRWTFQKDLAPGESSAVFFHVRML